MLLLTVLLLLENMFFFPWWMSHHGNMSCKSSATLCCGDIVWESISDEKYWDIESYQETQNVLLLSCDVNSQPLSPALQAFFTLVLSINVIKFPEDETKEPGKTKTHQSSRATNSSHILPQNTRVGESWDRNKPGCARVQIFCFARF